MPFTDTQRQLLREQSETQDAEVRLLLVTPPRLAESAQAEIERRTALFTAAYQASPRRIVMSPRRAAVRSVYEDLISERWV